MKDYYAESETNGIEFSHTFRAECKDTAQIIANNMGWELLGEYLEVEFEPELTGDEETLEAMMQKRLFNLTEH